MNKIELTPALLSDIKEKAERATPEKWDCVFDGLTGFHFLLAVQEHNKANLLGKIVNRGNGTYIAAVHPAVVLALIEKIERIEQENEELRANNYGPEILNDPQALTSCYFAGRMAEGREKNRKIDKLLEENIRLEKEANWLAFELQSKSKDPTFYTEKYWREFARKAVSEDK